MDVSPLTKDKVLNCLCESLDCESVYSLDIGSIFKETNTDFQSLNAILSQFQRLGFISELNMRRSSLALALHVEAFDFKNRGGFFVQEEVLKLTLEKLALEVDKLSSEFPDKLQTFTTIVANISTCLGLINIGK